MTEQKFPSQHGEDRQLAEHFSGTQNGVFVEVGAYDGVSLSNTWHFEHVLGWTGVLIEANPAKAEACQTNRPGSQVFAYAVVSARRSGERVNFDVVQGFEELSSLALRDRYRKYISAYNRRDEQQLTVSSIEVETSTVDAVLETAAVERVDFLTIDIEGHELEALRGTSLRRWRPRVVLIESTTRLPDPRLAMLLFNQGYAYRRTIVINDWYEPADIAARLVGLGRLYLQATRHLVRAVGRRAAGPGSTGPHTDNRDYPGRGER